jgi:hypothetical protein
MTHTVVTLHSSSIPAGTPLVIDLLDIELNLKWRGTAPVNTPVSLPEPLEPGDYAVIVGLPSGQTVQIMSRVEGEGSTLDVTLPTPVQTGVAAQPAHAKAPSPNTGRSGRSATPAVDLGKIWVRLWSRDASRRWRVRRWPIDLQHGTDGSVSGLFEAEQLPSCQHYIQIGCGSSQPRMTAIPSGRTSFVLRPSLRFDADEAPDISVVVDVYAAGPEAQTLIGYLSHGDLERAQVIGKDFLESYPARDVIPDPTTAVLGGYFFLACRDLARLEHLVEHHLSSWAAWLPDVAVIRAWQALRQQSTDVEKARGHLLDAVRCGIPIYTRGLRLLLDGLRMMETDAKLCDDQVRKAFNSIRRYAKVADWRPTYTTFLAAHPGKPINPRGGIRWLADAHQAAFDPLSDFPWARAAQHDPNDRQEEMRGRFSASFSRAFTYPPGHQDVHAVQEAYQALQEDMTSMLEASS